MPKRSRYHVTKQGDKWAVKKEGNQRASSLHETKKLAVDAGRSVAKNAKGQLLIHKKDGRFEEERTYGKDPYPPKG